MGFLDNSSISSNPKIIFCLEYSSNSISLMPGESIIFAPSVSSYKEDIDVVLSDIKAEKKLALVNKKPNKLKFKVKEVLKNID